VAIRFQTSSNFRPATVKLVQAAALALLVALAVPSRAADERPVRSRVAPVYPEIARRMRIAGIVKLQVTVDAEGKVTTVKTVTGSRMLASAAEDAVRKWKFAPGPSDSTVDLDINFALPQ
jgi:TonB family protein